MATTIDQQVVLDESLVPSTQRLRIGRSNFRLPFDIQSKESTLQVVYDIDTKKSVLNLEAFREMLYISPRIPSQSFAELPTEEEILEFLRNLGHTHEIRHLTDVNAYKEYYACAMGEATPKPKASDRKKKGDSASSTTPPTPTPTTTVGSALRLFATAKELSWNSSDDEKGDEQTKGRDESEGESDDGSDDDNDDDNNETVKPSSESDKDDDDNDNEEEPAKNDDEDTKSGKGGAEVSESEGEGDDEETRQEEEETFRFDERLRSLETTFSEYRQTNPFVDAVSVIP
nr:hypothetical protein [Tanacetum cinerariifolium]